ncbi:hypothetical protein ALON55S_04775 [Alishewanella longhuensis]
MSVKRHIAAVKYRSRYLSLKCYHIVYYADLAIEGCQQEGDLSFKLTPQQRSFLQKWLFNCSFYKANHS